MTDRKYERYLRKLDLYEPKLNIIARLDEMQAVFATDPIAQIAYFVYGGKVSIFKFEQLKGVDCSLVKVHHSQGSLGETLVGGMPCTLSYTLFSVSGEKTYKVLRNSIAKVARME